MKQGWYLTELRTSKLQLREITLASIRDSSNSYKRLNDDAKNERKCVHLLFQQNIVQSHFKTL